MRLLRDLVPRFAGARVLVVGDIIVDHFLWGIATRISPEAPVPVVNVKREDLLLGGSANVLRNIVSLGGSGALCGVIGDDAMGQLAMDMVENLGASTAGMVRDRRPTTIKTRVVAQGQQIVRFDREQTGVPEETSLERLLRFLDRHLAEFDAVVVSDYAKGVVGQTLMDQLRQCLDRIRMAEGRSLPLIVDPKPANTKLFRGATVITPNHLEAGQMAGIRIEDEPSLLAAASRIRSELGCQAVLVTRGEAGMALLETGQEIVTIPTMAKEVYDVTGAGDTVAATLSLGLASGCSMREAAVLANHAAGIVVGKVGTACVSMNELIAMMTDEPLLGMTSHRHREVTVPAATNH